MAVFLTPDNIRQESINGVTLEIKEKIIPDGAVAPRDIADWCKKGQPMKPRLKLGAKPGVAGTGKPLGITIHNTGNISVAQGTNAAEQYTRATYPNGNMNGVVVHFYVWHNEIWQNLRLDEQGWHAGDSKNRKLIPRSGKTLGGNLNTIAIECIGPDAASEDTTAKLTALLCQQFNLEPRTEVYQHKDFSGKQCPAYIIPHWARFIEQVHGYYVTNANDKIPKPGESLQKGDIVRFTADATQYYPEGPSIPAWAKTGDHHMVTQTIFNGDSVIKGEVLCVLLGKRVNLATGTISDGVNTWAAEEFLERELTVAAMAVKSAALTAQEPAQDDVA